MFVLLRKSTCAGILATDMFIIVGLGNPGELYEKNRHNAGRVVLEFLAKKYDSF